MALIQTVHLSMASFKSAPVVPAVQNDTDRQVKMIVDDFDLTSGMTGKIAFQRSDGTHYETSATLNTSDNSFTADIDQALTQPGRTMVQLKVTDTLTVSTFSFVIFVEQDNSGTVTPQEGIDLVSAVQAAEDAADRAEAAAETLELDDTLTESGKAADAAAVGNELDYIIYDDFDVPLVQGARGSDDVVVNNAKYVTSKNHIIKRSGDVLKIKVVSPNIGVILTEWNADGSYVGNVGSWKFATDYTFTNKNITITFRKDGGHSDIAPQDISVEYTLETPFSRKMDVVDTVDELIDNNFEFYTLNQYNQGYYGTDGTLTAASNYACIEMVIPTKEVSYKFPISNSYNISVYTWDYSDGTYSNFEQTGWITNDYVITVPVGKAMSCVIANPGGGSISADSITYKYYLLTAIGTLPPIKEWIPKKVACIGDSLTEGVDIGTHVIAENYPYFLGKMLGCTTLNCGVAGADTKEYWHDNMDDFTFDSSIDTVLIMLGTNGGGIPNTLETDVFPYTDYADYADTYCGCYCKIIRKVIELTQNVAQVILVTPPYTTYSTTQLNRVKTARETIKEIGVYFNIPVIDVFAECGMGAYNADVFRPHDGCHFNAKGYHRLGTYIGSKVKSLHSVWNLNDEYSDETPIT